MAAGHGRGKREVYFALFTPLMSPGNLIHFLCFFNLRIWVTYVYSYFLVVCGGGCGWGSGGGFSGGKKRGTSFQVKGECSFGKETN